MSHHESSVNRAGVCKEGEHLAELIEWLCDIIASVIAPFTFVGGLAVRLWKHRAHFKAKLQPKQSSEAYRNPLLPDDVARRTRKLAAGYFNPEDRLPAEKLA